MGYVMTEVWIVVLFNPITIYLMFIGLLILLDSIGYIKEIRGN